MIWRVRKIVAKTTGTAPEIPRQSSRALLGGAPYTCIIHVFTIALATDVFSIADASAATERDRRVAISSLLNYYPIYFAPSHDSTAGSFPSSHPKYRNRRAMLNNGCAKEDVDPTVAVSRKALTLSGTLAKANLQ